MARCKEIGASLVEYSLLVALIAVVGITSVKLAGGIICCKIHATAYMTQTGFASACIDALTTEPPTCGDGYVAECAPVDTVCGGLSYGGENFSYCACAT